jgi:hypothetical protein
MFIGCVTMNPDEREWTSRRATRKKEKIVSLIMHKSTSLIAVLDWIVYSSEFDCLTCCKRRG